MRRAPLLFLPLLLALTGLPALAEECEDVVQVHDCFVVEFLGATFDGTATEMTYCVTGLDAPGFGPALSMMVAVDPVCAGSDEVVDCDPEMCGYQADDPLFHLTGVRWDDLSIDVGETDCVSFKLEGDWRGAIGEVDIAIDAVPGIGRDRICGPICIDCQSYLDVEVRDGRPWLRAGLRHNRPLSVEAKVYFKIVDATGERVHFWSSAPVRFDPGSEFVYEGPAPDVPELEPGEYALVMALKQMSGWRERTATFTVPEE